MPKQTFHAGTPTLIQGDAPSGSFGAFFEDEGEVGYFYAIDLKRSKDRVLDAVHIYNVANVTDRDRTSTLSIVWSADESKCALLINGYPHAAFDFAARRGYCRTNYPNFPDPADGSWLWSDHGWSDDAVSWLELERTS
jgi:hypothetical protein